MEQDIFWQTSPVRSFGFWSRLFYGCVFLPLRLVLPISSERLLQGVGTGLMHGARIGTGGDCDGRPTLSKCRQSLTVEGLGWAEFGVCASTLLLTVFWVCTSTFAGRNKAFDSEANV